MGFQQQFSEQRSKGRMAAQAVNEDQQTLPTQILATTPDFVRTATGHLKPEFQQHRCEAGKVDWQTAMKRAIRRSDLLYAALDLPMGGKTGEQPYRQISGEDHFPTFVPLEFLSRMRPGDVSDPLLRQVLPISDEDDHRDERFVSDPVGDRDAVVASGLLHKYQGRALTITTGACGVHCRYCFRREFPYSENREPNWLPALNYIRGNPSIHEVILSGGDPLTVVDSKLFGLIDQIESIGHVRRLRVHSRMPIVIPQRVTAPLIERLASSRLAVWMVVHANHAAELDDLVLDRITAMVRSGITVLNQAVLLRGVNDDADTLAALCEKLINFQVMPYYLHQLDRVRGASHFEVTTQQGVELIEELRRRLPGYAVPQFVCEQAGKASKTTLQVPS